MVYCLRNLSKKSSTKYLNKTLWLIIIVFGSLLGQGIYLALETKNWSRKGRDNFTIIDIIKPC